MRLLSSCRSRLPTCCTTLVECWSWWLCVACSQQPEVVAVLADEVLVAGSTCHMAVYYHTSGCECLLLCMSVSTPQALWQCPECMFVERCVMQWRALVDV